MAIFDRRLNDGHAIDASGDVPDWREGTLHSELGERREAKRARDAQPTIAERYAMSETTKNSRMGI
jgi:hypothetical protein